MSQTALSPDERTDLITAAGCLRHAAALLARQRRDSDAAACRRLNDQIMRELGAREVDPRYEHEDERQG